MSFFVYIHRKADNAEIFYVGKGMCFSGWDGNEKFSRAYSLRSRNLFWHNIVKSHGFDVEIIKSEISENESFDLERELIAKYGRRDLNKGTLVNLTDGGDGVSGYRFTDSDKKKHHEALKIAMKDRIMSDVHKLRMSQKRSSIIFNDKMRKGIGIGNTKRFSKKVIVVHRVTGETRTFVNMTQVRKILHISHKTLTQNTHSLYSFSIENASVSRISKIGMK